MTTNQILRLSKSQETYDINIGPGLQICTVWWASFNHLISMKLFIPYWFVYRPANIVIWQIEKDWKSPFLLAPILIFYSHNRSKY